MLALKLTLVPAFLLLRSLAGKRWGPEVAGWLAGLPVVAGPILFFVAVEQGQAFTATAAASSLAAVFTLQVFSIVYAHAAWRAPWPVALSVALASWFVAAIVLVKLPSSLTTSFCIAAATLMLAPHLFPAPSAEMMTRTVAASELAIRMCTGALLTLFVTVAATWVGSQWSGVLAAFPLLASVLAVFSHRSQGTAFAAALLRGTATGLYSFAAFFLVLSGMLRHRSTPAAFVVAAIVALAVQALTKRHLAPRSNGLRVATTELEG